jgi:hypothetical protein
MPDPQMPGREQGKAQDVEHHLTALTVHPSPWRITRTDQTMPTVVDADGYIVAERVAPEAAQLIAGAGADARSRLSEEAAR